jgi:hypothetical protein
LALFTIERSINGTSVEQRRAVRQELSAPLIADLKRWLHEERPKLWRGHDLARAMDYILKRWPAFTLFLDDGRVCLSNNAAERALRGIAMRRSLCPSCSNLCKHWELVFWREATRAICSRIRGKDVLGLQVDGPDLIRCARDNLLSGHNAVLDQTADAVVRNPELCSGLGHRQPFAVLLGRTVGANAVYSSHRTDTMRCPGFALTGRHSHPVQRCGYVPIRPAGRHAPHHRECLVRRAASMFAGSWLPDAQL